MSVHSLSRLCALTLGSAAVVTGAVAAADPASAVATTVPLTPGQSTCVQRYAAYQVRAVGSATADGARLKLLRNGVVIQATPGRVTSWAAELRTAYGNFPGAGYYAACAYNTGTRNTTVFLDLVTDTELP